MKSIRFYLIVALISTVTLGNFVAAIKGYRSSTKETQALLDTLLADTASLLQSLTPPAGRYDKTTSDRLAYQVWTMDGDFVMGSENSGESPMTRFETGYRDENFSDQRWRVLGVQDAVNKRWIFVAERIDIRIALADDIVLKSVLPIVISLPFIAIIVWIVVGNGLAVVQRLASELGERQMDDLSPLQISSSPKELKPVIKAVDALLARLSDAVERERRFSADAAHELRTPLSALKVHIHNLRKERPDDKPRIDIIDRDVARLGHLIEQVLLLYRTTPENYRAELTTVELYGLGQNVIGELFDAIDDKGQSIELLGSAQRIEGDPASLEILLSNLVMNASKYSPKGATISVLVQRWVSGVEMVVRDTGPGLPIQELRRVRDRFYRAGGDRHSSRTEGSGLGLSIVQHIATLHGAELYIENNENGVGLSVSVRFQADSIQLMHRSE